MDDGVRVAEARLERGAGRDLDDERFVDRVHHHHALGVDGAAAGGGTDAERIEGGEGVRRELHAGADLADLGRLLEDGDAKVALREREGRCQPADAAADDEDRAGVSAHAIFSSRQRPSASCTGRSEKLKRIVSSAARKREGVPRRHDEHVARSEVEDLLRRRALDRRPAAALEADVDGAVGAAVGPRRGSLDEALREGADRRHRRAAGRRVDEAQLEAEMRVGAAARDADQRLAGASRTGS